MNCKEKLFALEIWVQYCSSSVETVRFSSLFIDLYFAQEKTLSWEDNSIPLFAMASFSWEDPGYVNVWEKEKIIMHENNWFFNYWLKFTIH